MPSAVPNFREMNKVTNRTAQMHQLFSGKNWLEHLAVTISSINREDMFNFALTWNVLHQQPSQKPKISSLHSGQSSMCRQKLGTFSPRLSARRQVDKLGFLLIAASCDQLPVHLHSVHVQHHQHNVHIPYHRLRILYPPTKVQCTTWSAYYGDPVVGDDTKRNPTCSYSSWSTDSCLGFNLFLESR